MNAEQYRAVIGWFNARPAAKKALRLVSRSAVALVYLLYLGMLAWLAWHRMGQLWPALVVPASAFVVGTLVRKLIDRPRPYTALGFTPLFPKDKTGQSMPSRHCFSAAAIAGTAWYVLPPLGAVLAVLGVLIAISRVVTGVHYISDVLAGLAFGSVFAVLGWNAFVLAASALARSVSPWRSCSVGQPSRCKRSSSRWVMARLISHSRAPVQETAPPSAPPCPASSTMVVCGIARASR